MRKASKAIRLYSAFGCFAVLCVLADRALDSAFFNVK